MIKIRSSDSRTEKKDSQTAYKLKAQNPKKGASSNPCLTVGNDTISIIQKFPNLNNYE